MNNIGQNLKSLRKKQQMTQTMLSKKTHIKIGHISRLENDITNPKIQTIYKLIDALNCTANELLMNEDEYELKQKIKSTFNEIEGLEKQKQIKIINKIEEYLKQINSHII